MRGAFPTPKSEVILDANKAALTDVLEMPPPTKTLPCGKCHRDVAVSANTVLAYCRECSAGLGVKK